MKNFSKALKSFVLNLKSVWLLMSRPDFEKKTQAFMKTIFVIFSYVQNDQHWIMCFITAFRKDKLGKKTNPKFKEHWLENAIRYQFPL